MACFALNPSINVGIRPASSWWLRYSFVMGKKMPSAAEMTDMDQIIQPGMIRRGNPELEAFTHMRHEFGGGWEGKLVQVDANISFLDERNPVMESIMVEHNSLVRIYENQRYFRRLSAEATLTVRPWSEHLSIWASPLLMHYMSGGHGYSHRQSIFRLRFGLDFSYGNWIFMAQTLSGPANDMYGEEIIEEKDMNQIMAGYKRPEWSVQAGVFNAFMNSYSMTTRNLSALAPYTSKGHCGHNTYFAVKVSVALNFGHRHLEDDDLPELMEINGDSGLANGLKSSHN